MLNTYVFDRDFLLKTLLNQSPWLQHMLLIICALSLGLLIAVPSLQPKHKEYKNLLITLDTHQKQYAQLQQILFRLPALDLLKNEIKELEQQIIQLTANYREQPEFHNELGYYLTRSGCKLLSLQPQPEQNQQTQMTTWQITLACNYSQILHFFRLIYQNSRQIAPELITLTKIENDIQLSLAMRLFDYQE